MAFSLIPIHETPSLYRMGLFNLALDPGRTLRVSQSVCVKMRNFSFSRSVTRGQTDMHCKCRQMKRFNKLSLVVNTRDFPTRSNPTRILYFRNFCNELAFSQPATTTPVTVSRIHRHHARRTRVTISPRYITLTFPPAPSSQLAIPHPPTHKPTPLHHLAPQLRQPPILSRLPTQPTIPPQHVIQPPQTVSVHAQRPPSTSATSHGPAGGRNPVVCEYQDHTGSSSSSSQDVRGPEAAPPHHPACGQEDCRAAAQCRWPRQGGEGRLARCLFWAVRRAPGGGARGLECGGPTFWKKGVGMGAAAWEGRGMDGWVVV